MKEVLKIIIISILIILPIILIVAFIFYLNLYRHTVPVTSENIERFNELFELNGVGIKIDETVKEIASVSSDAMAYSKFEVVYNDGKVKEFELEILRVDKAKKANKLSEYISENDGHNGNAGTWVIIFIISVIVSVYLIFDSGKTKVIY